MRFRDVGRLIRCVLLVTFVGAELPEEFMSTTQIIEFHGYKAESELVTSEDGYVLQMHRIPSIEGQGRRPVVFLQHGLLGSSADWVLNLPNQTFIFADAGFDVWLGNIRGNFYSWQHMKYDSSYPEFWKFTFDHHAKYDLPAMINRVLEVTGMPDLYYVGHSQGTLIAFAKLSEDPEFAEKIRHFYALAPVGSVGHIKGLIFEMAGLANGAKELSELVTMYGNEVLGVFGAKMELNIVEVLGSTEFAPTMPFMNLLAKKFCRALPPLGDLCKNVLFQIIGPNTSQFNEMVHNGSVRKYDFNSQEENKKHYGQETPPSYDFSTVYVPLFLYYGDEDWLADSQDVEA